MKIIPPDHFKRIFSTIEAVKYHLISVAPEISQPWHPLSVVHPGGRAKGAIAPS